MTSKRCECGLNNNIKYNFFKNIKNHINHFTTIWQDEMIYKKCQKCHLIFLFNKPSNHEFLKHYKSERLYLTGLSMFFKSLIKKKRDKYIFELILKNMPSKKQNILEIGCGDGSLIKLFDRQKHKIYGCELNPIMKKIGTKNKIEYIDNYKGKKFDVIILSHVFEHFLDIKKEIQVLYKCLNKDGLIYIEVPNIDNFSKQSVDEKIFENLFETDHIYNFSKNSLSFILEGYNFKKVFLQRVIYNISLNYKYNSELLIKNKISLFTIYNYIFLFIRFFIFNKPIYKEIEFNKKFFGYGDNLISIFQK